MPQLGRFSPGTLHQPLCSRPSRASWSSASTHPPPHFGAGGHAWLKNDPGLRVLQPGDTQERHRCCSPLQDSLRLRCRQPCTLWASPKLELQSDLWPPE